MIDWNASAELNGKSIDWLKCRFAKYPQSQLKVVAICDGCGIERVLHFFNSGNMCHKCGCAKRNSNPDYIKNRTDMFNSDEWKNSNKEAMNKLHNDAEYRNIQIEGCRRNAKDPEWVERNRIAMKILIERNINDPEWRERISAGHQKQDYDAGEWTGYKIDDRYGIPTNVYDDWRRSVYKRDGYRCKICGEIRYAVHAHHIRKQSLYPDLVLDINNGITMCKRCHETTYGEEELFAEELQMIIDGVI